MLGSWFGMAVADVDPSTYATGPTIQDPREQARLREELAQQLAAERQRAEQRAERERRAKALAAAAAAARPWPERLTEARCTLCHGAGSYRDQRHDWLGWQLVVWRMRWFNDAPVTSAEQAVIVDHLASAYPLGPGEGNQQAFAWFLGGLVLTGLPLFGVWSWRRRYAAKPHEIPTDDWSKHL